MASYKMILPQNVLWNIPRPLRRRPFVQNHTHSVTVWRCIATIYHRRKRLAASLYGRSGPASYQPVCATAQPAGHGTEKAGE
jgi:hypothetical protein